MRKGPAPVAALLVLAAFWAWSMDVRLDDKPWYLVDHAPMTTRCMLLFGATYGRRFAPVPPPPPPGREVCTANSYSFEFSAEVYDKPGPKSWAEVAQLPCKYLNFGGDVNRHSQDSNYFNYVSIQGSSATDGWGCAVNQASQLEECGEWCVCADLREKVPLPDASVDRIHSEDFMEHIHHTGYPALLREIYRLLKPGAHARMGMPEYGKYAASSLPWLAADTVDFPDPVSTSHRTLTNYALLKKYIDESPFKGAEWLQYMDNTDAGSSEPLAHSSQHLPDGAFVGARTFVDNGINYSLGVVRRTPGVDCRNNVFQGRVLTSLVFDLVKPTPPK